jgi:hypothetical protein
MEPEDMKALIFVLNEILRQLIEGNRQLGVLSSQVDQLWQLLSPEEPVGFRVTMHQGANAMKVTAATVDVVINENGTATATLAPVDASGNDTSMPAGASVPAWVSSDPDISVAPAADGLSALFTAGTTPITAATVTATSTLADGSSIKGTTDPIDVVAAPPGAAVAFKITMSSTPAAGPAARR